jgi:hypothetical protein
VPARGRPRAAAPAVPAAPRVTPAPPAPPSAAPAEPAPPAEIAPPAGEAPPAAETVSDSGPSRLAAEVALLDRARGRLVAGDYPAVFAAIDEYHQRFPRGDLDAEADAVTIEVLIAGHEYVRARDLATRFLARFPRSPLVQRVRSLLERLPPP